MKRILIVLLLILMGCTVVENDWAFYNERAETFVISMANGDFSAAVSMFDATMKRVLPVKALQDFWEQIAGQAGNFISVYEIENTVIEGYYVCFVTSRHELKEVTLRVVFNKNGQIAGLFIDAYTSLDGNVVIGEEFPLNGILSVPENAPGKVPAVVLVHGSGSSDMDETIYANKPFRDIAEYLTANGIAVLRYDKRNYTHGAKIDGKNFTVYEETIEDAILATEILKSDPRIDENKVFIIGHSLGGILAPRIHSMGGDYAGLILLAGSPRPILDILYDQNMAIVEKMTEGKEQALKEMEQWDDYYGSLLSLSDEETKNIPVMGGMSFYYYKEMYQHPAAEYIKNINVPFLVMQGTEDFQVYADKDFTAYQELLAGRSNVKFKLYEGLNHLFMTSTTGDIEEYKIAGKVDEQVLKDIVKWIGEN